jgi:hypothetical protein
MGPLPTRGWPLVRRCTFHKSRDSPVEGIDYEPLTLHRWPCAVRPRPRPYRVDRHAPATTQAPTTRAPF